MLALADGRPELLDPLVPGLRYLRVEAVYAVRQEMACSVADVLDRRTRASLRDARARPTRPAGWPPSSVPSWGGTPTGTADEADAYADGHPCAIWPGPGSTPARRPPRRPAAVGPAAPGPGMTRPTPVTPIDAEPGRRHRPPGRRAGRRSTTPCARRLATSAQMVDDDDGPGRGRPRLVAAGHRLGRRRPGAGPARRWWPGPPTPPRWPAVLALCNEARVPVTAGRRPQRGVRRLRPALRRGGPRPVRAGRHRSTSTPTRWWPTSGPAPSAPTSSPDLRTGTASPSATGPSRWTSPRWAGGWPAGGPASTPTATGRSRTWSSASRWCWPTAGWSGPAGTGPDRPPGPTSPSCSWAARARSGSSPRAGSGSTRSPRARAGGPSASPPSPTASTPAGGSCAGAPRPAVLRLYDPTESGRSFDHPDTNVLIVLDEADPGPGRRHPGRGRRRVRASAEPLDVALVERWLGHRNDVSALAPLWRAGIVVDTVEVAGPLARPARPLRRRARGPRTASRAPWSPRPTSPTPTPTAPASTSPSPAARRPTLGARPTAAPGWTATTGGPGTR